MTILTTTMQPTIVREYYDEISISKSNARGWWNVNSAQLLPGKIKAERLSLILGDYEYTFFQNSIKSLHKAILKSGLSFLTPLGCGDITYLDQQFDLRSGQPTISCTPQGQATHLITPCNFLGVSVTISNEKRHYLLENMYDSPVCCPPRYGTSLFFPTNEQYIHLQQLLLSIYHRFNYEHTFKQENQQWLEDISEREVIPLLYSIMSNRLNRTFKWRPDSFHAALNIIFSNIDSPPSINELSKQLKTTPRNLQYLFKSHLNMTPKQFIKVIRLNIARRRIVQSQCVRGNISDIANQLGFWHMGSFAQDFKKLFCNKPSELLQQETDDIDSFV